MALEDDIDVQRGTAAIGNTGGTSSPGTTFGSLTAAFVRNANNRRSHAGRDDQNAGNLEGDDMSGALSLTGTNTITYTRESGSIASDMRFAWESWEYTGSGGGANEFIVRSRDTVTLTGATNTATLANTPTDIDNCIPFITGIQTNQGTDSSTGQTAIAWLSSTATLNVKRGAGSTGTTIVQVVTVEFTGSNWTTVHGRQEGDTTDSLTITLVDDADGTTAGGGDVTDWANAIIFHQYVGNNTANVDDAISDDSATYSPGATTTVVATFNANHVDSASAGNREEHFIHALRHTEMDVTRFSDGQSLGSAMNVAITTANLFDLAHSGIECSHNSSGSGTAYGRGWINYRLTSLTNAEKWVHRSGNTINTVLQIINFDPSAVTITDFNTKEAFDWGDTNLVLTGTDFEAVQGTGMVEFWDDTVGTTKVTQTIDSWADTSIQIDTVQGGLANNTFVYLVVTNDTGRTNAPLPVQVGLPTYETIMTFLENDHYWRFNNVLTDTGETGPQLNMATEVGTTTYTTSNIRDGNTHAVIFNEITERIGPADSVNMNITINAQRRTISCWIQLNTNIQHPLGCIFKEGAQIQNMAFLFGYGNIVLAQMADNPGSPGNVQAWSDIRLTLGRPYHICMRYDFPNTFELFLDGRKQTETDGNPLGVGTFDSHSGDIALGSPDTTLETGGTDITYQGMEDVYISDFASWSENSVGADDGAISDTNILKFMFQRGAVPDDTISTGTESAMQTSLDGTVDARTDWPLSYRIEDITGGGDLELLFTDKVFNSRISDHLEWQGGGTLTVVRQGTTDLDSTKTFCTKDGPIVVVTQPDVTVTTKKASDLSTETGVSRVLMKAATGGDLPFEDTVTITRSGSTATVTHTAHGLRSNLKVLIKDADQQEYNGVQTITVTGVNAYTYTVTGTPATPATGTILATSVIIDGDTASGSITVQDHRYTTDQPVTTKVAKSTISPRYKVAVSSATIESTGLSQDVFLVLDE